MGIAFVTGTSTGIGMATAVSLARAGHTVYAGMRVPSREGELHAAIAKEKLPIRIVKHDVDSDLVGETQWRSGVLNYSLSDTYQSRVPAYGNLAVRCQPD